MKNLRLRGKVTKALQGTSRGLTLLEVLIAMALIGVLAIAFFGAISYASTVLIVSDRQAAAESLASSQIEYVKSLPDCADGYETDIPLEYTEKGYSATITVDNLQEGLQKITVVVNYETVRYDVTTRGYEMVAGNVTLAGYRVCYEDED